MDAKTSDTRMNVSPEGTISRRIIMRLVVPIMVLQVLNSLDRVNISFAALRMNADLGLSPERYGSVVSIFFVSYLLFQFPSSKALKVLGARWWIVGVVLLWGLAATGLAFVQEVWHLYALRFVLGIAEAGYAPGIVFLCSCWVPRAYRARAIATTMLAVPVSMVFGGPLSGWLLSMQAPFGVAAWRWMFFIEGVPTVVLAFVALRIFRREPLDADWLSADEKEWLRHDLRQEEAVRADGIASFTTVLTDARILCSAAVWFCLIFGAYGIIFWMPLVLQEMTALGAFSIGLLSALPWLGVAAGMVLVSRHSDRTQERFRHVGIAALTASLALLACVLSPWHGLALMLLFVFGVGLGGAQATFWTIPTAIMPRSVTANGVVLINLVGNVSSLINASVIGYLRKASGSYELAVLFLVAILGAAALLVGAIAAMHSRRQPVMEVT
jgi:ACS family tartrate transporter-like MFS transporter